MIRLPLSERRMLFDSLSLDVPHWKTSVSFDDDALFAVADLLTRPALLRPECGVARARADRVAGHGACQQTIGALGVR